MSPSRMTAVLPNLTTKKDLVFNTTFGSYTVYSMALAATAAKLLRDRKYKSLKKQSIASSGIHPVAKVLHCCIVHCFEFSKIIDNCFSLK